LRHSTGANKGDFRDLRVADPLSRFDSDDYFTWNQAMTTPAWSLHPQLAKDTISIGDLPLSRVFVIKDANYPWLLLVPRRVGATEILDLDEVEQAQLMTEIARVSRALKAVTLATGSTSPRSAMSCRNCMCTSSPVARPTPPGRNRCGARSRRLPMIRSRLRRSSASCGAGFGLHPSRRPDDCVVWQAIICGRFTIIVARRPERADLRSGVINVALSRLRGQAAIRFLRRSD
jgi:hypothetical protein